MQKQVSIHLDEGIYGRLCQVIGKGQDNRFSEEPVTPYVTGADMDETDRSRDIQALLWSEAIF